MKERGRAAARPSRGRGEEAQTVVELRQRRTLGKSVDPLFSRRCGSDLDLQRSGRGCRRATPSEEQSAAHSEDFIHGFCGDRGSEPSQERMSIRLSIDPVWAGSRTQTGGGRRCLQRQTLTRLMMSSELLRKQEFCSW